jgi:hypothetical protein
MARAVSLFFTLLLSLLCTTTTTTAPLTIKRHSLSTKNEFIIIDCRDGLSNRLRLLAGYLYVLRESKNISFSRIYMVWDINDACPGHFLQLFEPIHSVTFITTEDLSYLTPIAKTVYPPSYMNYLEVLNHFNLHHSHDLPISWHQSRLEIYSLFQPVSDLLHLIQQYVSHNSLCHHAAIHVRHTDLDRLIEASLASAASPSPSLSPSPSTVSSSVSVSSSPTATRSHSLFGVNHTMRDSEYENFINSLPETMKIFLMTDNPLTQRDYLRKFGTHRILIYQTIPSQPERVYPNHRRGLRGQSLSLSLSQSQSQRERHTERETERQRRKLNSIRYTTLQHTLIDVILAAHASIFLGNPVSSLSELVHLMNMTLVSRLPDPCYGQKHDKDRHRKLD